MGMYFFFCRKLLTADTESKFSIVVQKGFQVLIDFFRLTDNTKIKGGEGAQVPKLYTKALII
jgi:hypothetical protein